MADNGQPNSVRNLRAKGKGRSYPQRITLRCVELCGSQGYGEDELLEKWARDSNSRYL